MVATNNVLCGSTEKGIENGSGRFVFVIEVSVV